MATVPGFMVYYTLNVEEIKGVNVFMCRFFNLSYIFNSSHVFNLSYSSYKFICGLLITALFLWSFPCSLSAASDSSGVQKFSDVPENHYAFETIHKLRALGITNGTGDNKFGMGKNLTRAEFVNFLKNLHGWEDYKPEKPTFQDVKSTKWYFVPVETALKHGVIDKTGIFRPDDYITREEMAVMIVRSLGYENLAKQLSYLESPFDDVSTNVGYITIAKDMGIIKGTGQKKFSPHNNALREDAATMLARMYDRLSHSLDELHAFYAISSYPQIDMIEKLDSVSFGWSCLKFDDKSKQVVLDTSGNRYGFTIPSGFSEPVEIAKYNGVKTQLMVFASQDDKVYDEQQNKHIGLLEYILSTHESRSKVIDEIIKHTTISGNDNKNVIFDGVVIDFEAMKGETLKNNFTAFLKELRSEMTENNVENLYVAVHPKSRKMGYYDAYDYRSIGDIADRVILMAHDYNAKKLSSQEMSAGDRYIYTPLTPIDEIYYALREITNEDYGVIDPKKIWLQLSFSTAQWEIKNSKVVNSTPYTPDYEKVFNRILNPDDMEDVTVNYSEQYQNPYITYRNGESKFIIWYEDSRSIDAKIRLARMFNVNGISLWRLGNIPDFEPTVNGIPTYLDVWQKLNEYK